MEFIIYFLTAIGASLIGAVSGIGGGVIIKPVLDSMGKLPAGTVSFLSGCTVLTMAISSMIRNRNSHIRHNFRITVFLSLGAAAGGVLGRQAASGMGKDLGMIQTTALMTINGLVLIYVWNKSRMKGLFVKSQWGSAGIGLILGFISSFLGIGGGPLNLAVLYFFFSMEAKEAAANSLFIILISQIASLVSALMTHTIPDFPMEVLLLMCMGGVMGAIFGSAIGKRMDNKMTEYFFFLLLWVLIGLNLFHLFQLLVH